MANNYFQFSEMVSCNTRKEAEWLAKEIENWPDPYDPTVKTKCCELEIEDNGKEFGVWIYDSEYPPNFDGLVDAICKFQLEFGKNDLVVISWSLTCSKPRLGEFGGGAVRIQGGAASWFDARTLAESGDSK